MKRTLDAVRVVPERSARRRRRCPRACKGAPSEGKYRTVEEITGEIEALARSADVATTDRDAPPFVRRSSAVDFQFSDGAGAFDTKVFHPSPGFNT